MMVEGDLLEVAIHEAGHAVAHIRLEIAQEHASIEPDALTVGRVSASDSVYSAADAREQVVALCAGYGALIAAGYPEEAACQGCAVGPGSDFYVAAELIGWWQLPGGLEGAKARAVELMRQPANVAAVALVAQHLVAHGRLGVANLECLVALADGEITQAEFERFRAVAPRGAAE